MNIREFTALAEMTDRAVLVRNYENTLHELWGQYRRRSPLIPRHDARQWFYFYNELRHKCLA